MAEAWDEVDVDDACKYGAEVPCVGLILIGTSNQSSYRL